MNHLALLAALVCTARECLAQDPVSALDGKAGIAAGEDNSYYAEASFAFPLGRRYGGQLDGLIGDQGRHRKGLGAQLFWRDPARRLFGANASYLEVGSIDVQRVGLAANFLRTL
jgi:hypothetical protein